MLSILKDLNHCRSFLICFLLLNCNKEQQQLQKIKGYALGTSYSISYIASELNPEVLIQRVDSIFEVLNNSLSTYIPDSDISKINKGDSLLVVDEHFVKVYQKASEVWEQSEGFFDPTVGALVNAYGFGPGNSLKKVTDKKRDSLLILTGWSKTKLTREHTIKKVNPAIYFDFNALAKGYAVDVLANYLKSKSLESYLVEIGGEIVAQGESPKFQGFWKFILPNFKAGIDETYSSISKKYYLKLCQKYCPKLKLSDLEYHPSGIRAQAVSNKGELIHDFMIERTNRTIHVCNAPSPAATSAFPIGKYISELS